MEQSESGVLDSAESDPKRRTLQVVFEIELSESGSCPLSDPESSVEAVHNQIDGEVCHADVTVADEGDSTQMLHTTTQVGDSCLCLAFSDVGCVPRFRRVDGGTILIETYAGDRNDISELVARLKSVTDRVSLRRLTTRQQTDGATVESTTVDLSRLTAKQREAATIAVSEGYYQTPRQTSLEELSEALGISKSALSQRLSAVESKLATAAFDP
jgi:predicted DNA binding protein